MSGFKSCMLAVFIAVAMGAAPVYAADEVSTHGAGEATTTQKVILKQLEAGLKALNDEDFKTAAAIFQSVILSPEFASLSEAQQYYTYYYLAIAEYNLDQYQAAYDHLIEGAKRAPDERDADYWYFVCSLGLSLDKVDISVPALIRLAQQYPDEFRNVSSDFMFALLGKIEALPDNKASYAKVLQLLWDNNYRLSDPLYTLDAYWFDLLEIRVSEGKLDKAREFLARIDDPDVIIRLRSDKRYRDLIISDALRNDFQAVFDRQLDRHRILAATYPRRSEAVVYLAIDLRRANKLDEALETLDVVIDKVKKAPKDKPPYDDLEEQYNWVLDTRSDVLAKQGKWKAVEAFMIEARDFALSQSHDNVSQRLNLGVFYFEQGRPQDALDEIKTIDHEQTSGFGSMVAENVRACAYAQLGDKERLNASLDYLRTHAKDGRFLYRRALLCANDLEGVARLIVTELDDPLTRNAILTSLQTYLPDLNAGSYEKVLTARNAKVMALPQIQAAIAKYGYIETYPVYDW